VVPRRAHEHGGVQLYQPSPADRDEGTWPGQLRRHQVRRKGLVRSHRDGLLLHPCAGANRARAEGAAARPHHLPVLKPVGSLCVTHGHPESWKHFDPTRAGLDLYLCGCFGEIIFRM
jgi:hypothetical protein